MNSEGKFFIFLLIIAFVPPLFIAAICFFAVGQGLKDDNKERTIAGHTIERGYRFPLLLCVLCLIIIVIIIVMFFLA